MQKSFMLCKEKTWTQEYTTVSNHQTQDGFNLSSVTLESKEEGKSKG